MTDDEAMDELMLWRDGPHWDDMLAYRLAHPTKEQKRKAWRSAWRAFKRCYHARGDLIDMLVAWRREYRRMLRALVWQTMPPHPNLRCTIAPTSSVSHYVNGPLSRLC